MMCGCKVEGMDMEDRRVQIGIELLVNIYQTLLHATIG